LNHHRLGRASVRLLLLAGLGVLAFAVTTVIVLPGVSRALNPRPEPIGSVLVVGDSVAYLTGEGLTRISDDHRLDVANGGKPGCGFVRGGEVFWRGAWTPVEPECQDWPQRWQTLVDKHDPDVVVLLVGFWDVFDRRIDGRVLEFGTPEADRYTRAEMNPALGVLGSRGATVVLLTTPYFAPTPDGESLSARDEERVAHINELFRIVADRRGASVQVRDFNEFLTPNGYRRLIGGVDMRGDGVHLTRAGEELVAEWLAPQVVELIETQQQPRG
jgi:hypothetical protein